MATWLVLMTLAYIAIHVGRASQALDNIQHGKIVTSKRDGWDAVERGLLLAWWGVVLAVLISA